MRKTIFITIDGLADRPCLELGGKTPLQAAKMPNLTALTAAGGTGVHYPVKKGISPESDKAVAALLGYDPLRYLFTRGPIEALGAGVRFTEGDLVLRTNFATVRDAKIVDRRAGRNLSTKEAKQLEASLNKARLSYPFTFKATSQHRGILIFKGSFSDNITDTDPAYRRLWFGIPVDTIQRSKPLDDDEVTVLSANLLNSFTDKALEILSKHPVNNWRKKRGLLPANALLARGAGTSLPELPPKRRKWHATLTMPVEIGFAKLTNMTVNVPRLPEIGIYVERDLYSCLEAEIASFKTALAKSWSRYDVFWLHTKPVDTAGHDGKPVLKKAMLELLDRELFSALLRKKNKATICVTGDHATPCSVRSHSADPVPFLIVGKKKDAVTHFDELACKKGTYGEQRACDLLGLLQC